MKQYQIVVDTNVLIAGLRSRRCLPIDRCEIALPAITCTLPQEVS